LKEINPNCIEVHPEPVCKINEIDTNKISSSVLARLIEKVRLGHGDLRSVHQYQLGTEIMREVVKILEKPAKILALARKRETKEVVNY